MKHATPPSRFTASFGDDVDASSTANLRFALALVLGGFLGLVVSFLVTTCLLSIFTSPAFAVYFGLSFAVLGAGILVRVQTQPTSGRRIALSVFACLVMVSGVLCLALRPSWLGSTFVRILLSSLFASCNAFMVTFILVDVVALAHDTYSATGLVDSSKQVWMLLLSAVVLGATLGIIYGAMDVQSLSALRLDVAVGLPVGVVMGAACGVYNEHLRNRELEVRYSKLVTHDDGV
jgi:hypothetical protein